MTNRDRLFRRQTLLLALAWWALALSGFATELAPSGTRSSNGARFGAYAAQVQSGIKEALGQNSKTRAASISGVIIRIWIDKTGRVNRAELTGTTGDTSLDSAITNDVLTGLQLKDPPPVDMPMPIVLRVAASQQASFGAYVAQVLSRVQEALLQNSKTRTALISGVPVRIWIDKTGRVTRAQLVSATGDRSLDRTITDEVLTGLQLKEPPPAEMSMPIVLRLTLHSQS